MSDILATRAWPDNGALMYEAVAPLGYIQGRVLDATYGEGTFWKRFPNELWWLTTNDLYKEADLRADFCRLPFRDEEFDAVVFDPPYKLSGTPALGQFDLRYGVGVAMPWQERMRLIRRGALECLRVTKAGGHTLVKCQDQVCSGKVVWQTDEVTHVMRTHGADKLDRFDLAHPPRPQPAGRKQVHARRNTSQLLVFRRS